MKFKKGDRIRVTIGKDRGKEAVVDRAWPKENKIVAAGVNMYKRHTKPQASGQKGSIREFPRRLPISNVALICPKCKQATRAGYKLTNKEKVRTCRKCGQEI